MDNYQFSIINYQLRASETSGGYCSGVPPLPIPNREVKPACADGTAMQCGRVGGRHLSRSPESEMTQGFFIYCSLRQEEQKLLVCVFPLRCAKADETGQICDDLVTREF